MSVGVPETREGKLIIASYRRTFRTRRLRITVHYLQGEGR